VLTEAFFLHGAAENAEFHGEKIKNNFNAEFHGEKIKNNFNNLLCETPRTLRLPVKKNLS